MKALSANKALITSYVANHCHVLDIGCGDGRVMAWLARHKHCRVQGIERDKQAVRDALARGLAVIEDDAEHAITHYPDKSMDVVLLNQSLQMMHHPHLMLREAARVGKQVIVSVPNFGYWYNRYYLAVRGRMPVSKQLNYAWYETPNIHFCTLGDFEELCAMLRLDVLHHDVIMPLALPQSLRRISWIRNVLAQKGIFVVTDMP